MLNADPCTRPSSGSRTHRESAKRMGRKTAKSTGKNEKGRNRKRGDSDSSTGTVSSTGSVNDNNNINMPLSRDAQDRADKLMQMYFALPYGSAVTFEENAENVVLFMSLTQILVLHIIIYRFNFNTYNFLMLFASIFAIAWRYAVRTGRLFSEAKSNRIETKSAYALGGVLVACALWNSVWSVIFVLPILLLRYYVVSKRMKTSLRRSKKGKRSTVKTGGRHEYVWVFMAIEELVFNAVEVTYFTSVMPLLFVSSPMLYFPGTLVVGMVFVFVANCANTYLVTLLSQNKEKLSEILITQGCWIKKPEGWGDANDQYNGKGETLKPVNAFRWDSTKLFQKTDCVTYKDTQYITYYDSVLATPGSLPMYILHKCYLDYAFTRLVLLCIQAVLVIATCFFAYVSPYWPAYILQVLCSMVNFVLVVAAGEKKV